MSTQQSLALVQYARLHVDRLREDVNLPKQKATTYLLRWQCADMIASANRAFASLLRVDNQIREMIYATGIEDDALDVLESLLRQWYAACDEGSPVIDRIEAESGPLDGSEKFRDNLREAKAMLREDDNDGDALTVHAEAAIAAHRAGLTEAMP